jgi:ABC-type sugar transport system ATPase subunit
MGLSNAVIQTCSNDELLLGIRPEHLKIAAQGSHAIEGIVKFLEPTGADLFVTVLVGSESIVVRCEPKTQLVVGSTVYLGFDMENSHLFASDGWNLRTKI